MTLKRQSIKKITLCITALILILTACNNNKSDTISVDLNHREILKTFLKDDFHTVDNTGDLGELGEILEQTKEGLYKAEIDEQNELLSMLEAGDIDGMETLIDKLVNPRAYSKEVTAQLWYVMDRLYILKYEKEDNFPPGHNVPLQMGYELAPNNPSINEQLGQEKDNVTRYSEAKEFFKSALDYILANEKNNKLYQEQTIRLYYKLALTCLSTEEYKESGELLEKGLSIIKSQKKSSQLWQAKFYNLKAAQLTFEEKYDDALLYCLEAEKVMETIKEPNPFKADIYNRMGIIYSYKKDYPNSLSYYQKALDTAFTYYTEENKNFIDIYNNIALHYFEQSDFTTSLQYYIKSLNIITKNYDKRSQTTITQQIEIAYLYSKLGNYEEALSIYESTLKTSLEVYARNHKIIIKLLSHIASMQRRLGYLEESLENYELTLNIRLENYPEEYLELANNYNSIGVLLANLNKTGQSIIYYNKALNIYKEHNITNTDLATIYLSTSLSYYHQNEYNQAYDYALKAHKIFKDYLGEEHKQTKEVVENIKQIIKHIE